MISHEILGVSTNASRDEINQAYRKLAWKYHPDRNPGNEEAVEKFKQIQVAFDFLNRQTIKVTDIAVELTLEEVLTGIRKTVKLEEKVVCSACIGKEPKACSKCFGSGKMFLKKAPFNIFVQCDSCIGTGRDNCQECLSSGYKNIGGREVVIDIPAGVDNDSKIKVFDVTICITVKNHRLFTREGIDLHLEVPVSYTELVFGTELVIPCLNKQKITLTIPPRTVPTTSFRIKNMGLVSVGKKGDLVVDLVLYISSDKEYLNLLEKLVAFEKIDRSYLHNL